MYMKYLIFDFNGTVIDDLEISLEAINHTVKKYLDRGPVTREEYYDVFTFPVIKYYEALGFDFNKLDWLEVGQCWMDYYLENRYRCVLNEGIKDFLIESQKKGYINVILSASMHDHLVIQLKELGVYEYFDEILGQTDFYAYSKLESALNFIKDKNPNDCLMFGDSLHDLEVAKAMNVECILVAKGHQNRKTLETSGCRVVDCISEVKI